MVFGNLGNTERLPALGVKCPLVPIFLKDALCLLDIIVVAWGQRLPGMPGFEPRLSDNWLDVMLVRQQRPQFQHSLVAMPQLQEYFINTGIRLDDLQSLKIT